MAPPAKAAIQGKDLELLRELVREMRGATLIELCEQVRKRTGISVSTVTMHATLRRAGLQRVKARQPAQAVAERKRYGYTDQHRARGAAGDENYASCLTDAEWALAADLFELPKGSRGRPATYERRHMVDACCYVLRTGCPWAMLPKSFPPWLSVHKTFSRWTAQGKFEALQGRLAEQWRQRIGRLAQPSAAVIDSQSNRISPQGGASGFDAGKKVKGRKRHIVVDTLGLLLAVSVTAASVQDRDGASDALAAACTRHQRVQTLFADSAYAGQCAQAIEHKHAIAVQIVRRSSSRGEWDNPQASFWPESSGFVVLPKRWVVERTHAWLERSRRLVMHYDRSLAHARAWAWLSQARMLLNRLGTST
jgi:putative transposase